uniref:CoB--CoM heterodisulfide reductase iron-sulfur subunit A family protein n=1 Tax=Desulfobacca acetoxidans TaxID=60893 RepID=A0A7C5ALM2_9BACT
MSKRRVLLCACPDLHLPVEELSRRLTRMGLEVRISRPLCAPAGFKEWGYRLRDEAGGWLIGACEAGQQAGFFRHLAGKGTLKVVDLLGVGELEGALGLLLTALEETSAPARDRDSIFREVLVVGGGVGGCQAALDLAQAGVKVYLLESSLSIGGIMAQLDKTFPTLDCSICILGPKLVEVASHPLIELLTFAELTTISGEAGRFTVDLFLRPRYVDLGRCVGCGTCAAVCPVIVPSRWNLGMKSRKCIRIIFAQAVPLVATIEREYCIDCRLCLKACEHGAIDLESRPVARQLKVGAIVLATGARPFDPVSLGNYGYGHISGVLTNLEFERLICATGPTQGRLLTPEGRPVRRLAFVQCVGSRDRRHLPYCSGYCCTATLKQAMVAREHDPEVEITVFYNDIRTSGKGFEELYHRSQAAGVRFIRGLPGRLGVDDEGRPVVIYENQAGGLKGRLTVDLVVLAVGLAPPPENLPFVNRGPARNEAGFYACRHPILQPLEASIPGVFLVGTCQGPRDISETVSTGSSAATRVLHLLSRLSS